MQSSWAGLEAVHLANLVFFFFYCQVADYGIGGYYDSHMDYFLVRAKYHSFGLCFKWQEKVTAHISLASSSGTSKFSRINLWGLF